MLLGNSVSSDVFDRINSNPQTAWFGSEFEAVRQDFFKDHVIPARQLEIELGRTFQQISNPDTIRLMDRIEDYKFIPYSMELPILLFDPVRELFEQGRVEGFGFDPKQLEGVEDVYGRMLSNFYVPDVAAVADSEGVFTMKALMRSTDPELNADELWSIRRTREFIMDKILAETKLDPTSILEIRG